MTWKTRLLTSITERSVALDRGGINAVECVVEGVHVGSGIVATAVGTGAVTSTICVVKRTASVNIASLPPVALVSRAIRNA